MARFQKGQSGNPAGKPPGTKNKTTIAIRQLLEEHTDEAIQTMLKLMRSSDESIAFKASQEILSRLFGKPPQALFFHGEMTYENKDSTPRPENYEQWLEYKQKIIAQLPAADVIDSQPANGKGNGANGHSETE